MYTLKCDINLMKMYSYYSVHVIMDSILFTEISFGAFCPKRVHRK